MSDVFRITEELIARAMQEWVKTGPLVEHVWEDQAHIQKRAGLRFGQYFFNNFVRGLPGAPSTWPGLFHSATTKRALKNLRASEFMEPVRDDSVADT